MERLRCMVEPSHGSLLVNESDWLIPQRCVEESQIWFGDVKGVVHKDVETTVVCGDDGSNLLILGVLGMVRMHSHTHAAKLGQTGRSLVHGAHENDVRLLARC